MRKLSVSLQPPSWLGGGLVTLVGTPAELLVVARLFKRAAGRLPAAQVVQRRWLAAVSFKVRQATQVACGVPAGLAF